MGYWGVICSPSLFRHADVRAVIGAVETAGVCI